VGVLNLACWPSRPISPTTADTPSEYLHVPTPGRENSGSTDGKVGSRFVEHMLSVVATCRQQNRNVLELLTACCRARLEGFAPSSLLPAEAKSAAARDANLTLPGSRSSVHLLTRGAFSRRFPGILGIFEGGDCLRSSRPLLCY